MAYRVDEALRYLKNANDHNRLAHAFLFTAEQAKEPEELALKTIRMLLGTGADRLSDLKHPSVRLVRPESLSRRIKVDQIREFERFVHLASSAESDWKIGVIHEADRLGESSENALLKTLEEPPSGMLLILTTTQPERLLPTVRSRCLRVELYRPHVETDNEDRGSAVISAVVDHVRSPNRGISGALRIAYVMERELAVIKERIGLRHKAMLKEENATYGKTTEGSWLKDREDYYKAITQSEYLGERTHLVSRLLQIVAHAIRLKAGFNVEVGQASMRLAESEDLRTLLARYDALDTMRSHLETMANEKLVIEADIVKAFA